MPTVFERIKANRFTVTTDIKLKIGQAIAKKYFERPLSDRPPLTKKTSFEPDGTFTVWIYPKRFEKTMDAIIKLMCHTAGVQRTKRKRIVKK
jgi:hypothetical protein